MVAKRARRYLTVVLAIMAVGILAAGTVAARSADPLRGSGVGGIAPPQSRRPDFQARATPSGDSAADDLALILQRLKVDFANPDSPYPHDGHVSSDNQHVQEWLSSLGEDGRWPDLTYVERRAAGAYNNATTPSFHSNAHLIRLAQMTLAYANPGNPLYHSSKVADAVARGLAYWYKNHSISDNWWDNTIGEPLLLSRIMVPLVDVLPADILRQGESFYVTKSDVDPSYSRAAVSFPQQQLIRGALTHSAADVAEASAEMQRIIRIRTDEGIQRDLSFHQHGPQLYNGGYGLTLIVDMVNYATVLRGTRWAFTPDKLSLLVDHLLYGYGHMIRGKAIDYSSFGRTLLRRGAGQAAVELEPVCDQLAALLPERAGELMALKAHIAGTGKPYSYLGNTMFWNSDFMTQQREAYYISVKMVSYRTIGTETIHAENMKGDWLPFGATWILRRGDEYNSILPVLDWARLPGVTSPHMVEPPLRNDSQPEGFVGGVSDGTYGAAAMIFDEREPTPLVPVFKTITRGRKSWFFFDREMIALGAGITSVSDQPVGTTLNQTGLHGPVLMDGHTVETGETNVAQGAWVLHDDVGYVLLASPAATLKTGTQTGEASPSRRNPAAPPTAEVFTLWIDHGVHPQNAQYAYAVLPGTNAQQLGEWVAHSPVRIIANTPEQQAVMNDQLGVAEIVFYHAGSVALTPRLTVKVDHPCIAMLVKHGKSTRIAVSSPGGEFFSVHLTLASGQKAQTLNFEMPSGDMAGKSQVMEAPVRW